MSESGIENSIELALGRSVLTEAGEHDSLVHVWWRNAPGDGCFVQVYVNGELTEVSDDPAQRDLWLVLDRARAWRIELLAVSADAADELWKPRPELLTQWSPPVIDRAEVRVLRDEALPVDTRLSVVLAGQPVPGSKRPLWSDDTPRSGFGGLFGVGGFGRDAAAGLGLGRGELGFGPLGTDAEAWRWTQTHLPPGEHELAVAATDAAGHSVASTLDLPTVTADALPSPAQNLEMQPDFTLAWTP